MKRAMTEEEALIEAVMEKVGYPYHKNIFERIPRKDILTLKAAGFSQQQIGDYYGVSTSAIRRRMRHESW